MHQNLFRRWGSLQRSPDPLAGFKGPYLVLLREGEREGKAGGREEDEGKGGKEGRGPPCVSLNFLRITYESVSLDIGSVLTDSRYGIRMPIVNLGLVKKN